MFFAPTDDHALLLAERRHWIAESPEEYALLTATGGPLLAEAAALAREWGAVLADDSVQTLGGAWEPDFVLLSLGDDGAIVEGGAVCFPTSWALSEKVGRTLMETHGPVPRLNEELAVRITTALRKLVPGTAWERDNWGLVRTPELNRHPRMRRARLDETVAPEEIWLRLEHQVLFKMPRTGGVLFGIRIGHVPLPEVKANQVAREGLQIAMETMPVDAAGYKGVAAVQAKVARWLGDR